MNKQISYKNFVLSELNYAKLELSKRLCSSDGIYEENLTTVRELLDHKTWPEAIGYTSR